MYSGGEPPINPVQCLMQRGHLLPELPGVNPQAEMKAFLEHVAENEEVFETCYRDVASDGRGQARHAFVEEAIFSLRRSGLWKELQPNDKKVLEDGMRKWEEKDANKAIFIYRIGVWVAFFAACAAWVVLPKSSSSFTFVLQSDRSRDAIY